MAGRDLCESQAYPKQIRNGIIICKSSFFLQVKTGGRKSRSFSVTSKFKNFGLGSLEKHAHADTSGWHQVNAFTVGGLLIWNLEVVQAAFLVLLSSFLQLTSFSFL